MRCRRHWPRIPLARACFSRCWMRNTFCNRMTSDGNTRLPTRLLPRRWPLGLALCRAPNSFSGLTTPRRTLALPLESVRDWRSTDWARHTDWDACTRQRPRGRCLPCGIGTLAVTDSTQPLVPWRLDPRIYERWRKDYACMVAGLRPPGEKAYGSLRRRP